MTSNLKQGQAESDRQRRRLETLATEYHKVALKRLAELVAEYRSLVPHMPRMQQDSWWSELTVLSGEIERLEVEHEFAASHLTRRAAANALPHARDLLERTAYFALLADGTCGLLQARGAM